ncbi:hypothetical protein ACVIN2_005518 [Bradyrhizobium sp. USDA 3650]
MRLFLLPLWEKEKGTSGPGCLSQPAYAFLAFDIKNCWRITLLLPS